jgi:hypothetical protein
VRVDLRQVAEIPVKSQRGSTGLPDVLHGSIDCALIDIGDDDLCPFTRERGRDRAAETASSTEDKRRLFLQSQIHVCLPLTTTAPMLPILPSSRATIFHYVEA